MKKKLMVGFFVVGVLVLILASSVYAGVTQEFRGLEWGDLPTRNMIFFEQNDLIKSYTKLNENLHMGEVPLSSIVYMFYDNRFMEVRLHFKGRKSYETLIMICKEKFSPLILNYYKPQWLFLFTTLDILYDDIGGKGYIRIFEKFVTESWQNELAKKEKELAKISVKKTEGDW